jgi:hypothetical protein
MSLCSNCQERPRRRGRPRCSPCGAWYDRHGRTERPLDLPYTPRVPRDAPCCHCGQFPRQYGALRCSRCQAWYYTHGHTERPLSLHFPQRSDGPCSECGWTAGRFTRNRCAMCYMRWWRRERRAPRVAEAS